ncbi:MAG: methyltransferase domain-containing protein [Cyanobium sp.]
MAESLAMARHLAAVADPWDQRYREGSDGWELGRPAPPLEQALRRDPRIPKPPARVLVPGSGRGHEAALLAALGFNALGLDVSGEGLAEARRIHGAGGPHLRWLQADLLDREALARAGLGAASLGGVVEHTCFCAITPEQRPAYLAQMHHLLEPGGWLLGLFWCHSRPGGPPYGSDPLALAMQIREAGFNERIWEPARGSVDGREGEWLGLWTATATVPW